MPRRWRIITCRIWYELNAASAKLAREAAQAYEVKTPDKPRFVAGVIGPTTKTASISPDVNDPGFRNITFDQLVVDYTESIRVGRWRCGHSPGGNHFRFAEFQGGIVCDRSVFEDHGIRLPIMISVTITDASGRTLSGQTPEAFWNSISHTRPLSVGINCALGAELMRPYIEELSGVADVYISVHPNAGLPNPLSETGYDETPEYTASQIKGFAEAGFVNVVGGCCGTTPRISKRLPAR